MAQKFMSKQRLDRILYKATERYILIFGGENSNYEYYYINDVPIYLLLDSGKESILLLLLLYMGKVDQKICFFLICESVNILYFNNF